MAEEPPPQITALQGVAIQGYDRDRRVLYWNAASEALYGYSREEALGRRLEDLIIPPPMRAAVIAEIATWIDDGLPPAGGMLTLQRADGTPIRVLSNHLIVRNEADDPRLFCIDLADPRHRVAEFDPANPVALSTAFLNSLSHEFRTPLNAILGFVELIARRTPDAESDPELAAYFKHVRDGGAIWCAFSTRRSRSWGQHPRPRCRCNSGYRCRMC